MPSPTLTRIIFGAMGLPNLPAEASRRLIHSAIDHGITSFDTAPLYGAGESERILGKALSGRRDGVQLLTKCGLRWDSDHGQPMFEMPVDGGLRMVRKDSRPAGIRASLEASLRDLDTDFIDVYQVHHYDDETPIEDVIGELERALAAGKIRAIGVSNYQVRELRRAQAAPCRLFSTQSPYSLVQQQAAAEVLAAAHADGLAFLAYEPLARGVLAGKYLARPPEDSGSTLHGLTQVNAAITSALLPLARERGVTIAQIALAWVLAQPGMTAAIAGASSEKQVAENAAAASIRLEPTIVAAITAAFRGCSLEERVTLLDRIRRRARRLKQAARRRAAAWFR
jgi:aryl-alcohol dehydrogenase-like predicted oxidoreductase